MTRALPLRSATRRPSSAGSGGTAPSRLARLATWAAALTLDDVPERVVDLARSQVLSQLAAMRGGLSHPDGRKLVAAYGPPLQPDPERSACVLAGLGSWLHFDDTAYAGHLSNSTVGVPLAYAYALGLDGRSLLTAVLAANECAARLTAAATLGPLRGQMAAHTNLAGAIAGRLRAERAGPERWVDAFGLAFALAPTSSRHGYLASDARLLGSLLPVRLALTACDAAAGGLRGAPDILEHPAGFLARFASVPLPEEIDDGLGRRWYTETLSFKVHPSGPGTDAAVDCALALHPALSGVPVEEIVEVRVETSLYTVLADRAAGAYVNGPGSPVSALVTTTGYAVATALLTGALTPADYAAPAVTDPRRWALAGRVRLVHDPRMSAALLGSTAPFGAALARAGERGRVWLREFGGEELVALAKPATGAVRSFARARKATPARVVVRLASGARHEHRVDIPVGAAGPATRAGHAELVRAKFLGTGGPAEVADAVRLLDRLSAAEVRRLIVAALTGAAPA